MSACLSTNSSCFDNGFSEGFYVVQGAAGSHHHTRAAGTYIFKRVALEFLEESSINQWCHNFSSVREDSGAHFNRGWMAFNLMDSNERSYALLKAPATSCINELGSCSPLSVAFSGQDYQHRQDGSQRVNVWCAAVLVEQLSNRLNS